ncbi:DUF2232 domain-containing protein [Seleniivibrio sp.]|uniref:DUF2232 domain-containing protein n=1 Tax=Seleniivibrio sp. TaxID=2898801 RepID=UPI0025D21EE3|nr:DUF2232 domain-containing protein [Seleniivibrio sp.]MCD8552584.1 YybS family protein [Seleniivibrio sp.]
MTKTILYPLASVLFYALLAYYPQYAIIGAVFSPLLLLVYLGSEKRNKYSDLMLGAAIALTAGISIITTGLYVISVAFTAVFIFKFLHKGHRDIWFPVTVVPLLVFIVMAAIIYGIPDYRNTLINVAEQGIKSFIETVKASKGPMSNDPYFLNIEKQSRLAAQSVVLIFPAVNYILTAFCTHIAFSLYTKLKRIEINRFRLPDNLVWILILGFALVFVKQTMAKHAGLNIILIMMTLYAFQGFDIVSYWMTKFKFIPVIKAIIFIFIFSEPPFIIFIALLGLFSVWFNLYGRQENDREQTPSD